MIEFIINFPYTQIQPTKPKKHKKPKNQNPNTKVKKNPQENQWFKQYFVHEQTLLK